MKCLFACSLALDKIIEIGLEKNEVYIEKDTGLLIKGEVDYSNTEYELYAPGEEILSTVPDNK